MNNRNLQFSHRAFAIWIALFCLIIPVLSLNAQELTLPVYRLSIAQADLDALLANPFLDHRKPAILTADSVDYPVEVRFRGATCRDLPKKSWKIYFEDEGPLGWEETNLNAEYRDRSLLRNALCMDLAREVGLPAPDFRYISLFVNGEYWGVHHEIESIDEDFFERRDLEMEALFKSVCHGCRFAPLVDPERLTDYYEVKYAPRGSIDTLAARFVFFQNATRDVVEAHVDDLVDVEDVMTYFAVQYAVNNQDGFSKNYYVNSDQANRYHLYPWDCDASLGNDWTGEFIGDPYNRNLGLLVVQVLFQRLIAIDDYCDLFLAKLNAAITGGFDTLAVRAQRYHDLIQHDIYLDTMKRGTNEEFEQALTDLQGYISERRTALTDFPRITRIDVEDYSPTVDYLEAPGDPIFVSAYVAEDPEEFFIVLMDNAQHDYWVSLYDDGFNGDSIAGDHKYSRLLLLPDAVPPIYYTFRTVPQNLINVSYTPPSGDFNFRGTPLDLPVIDLADMQPVTETVQIESAVRTRDNETHAITLRNIGNHDIRLSGHVVRLGQSARLGRIGRPSLLHPGQLLVFTNHPAIISPHYPGEAISGGFYFPVQPGDTVSLETPSGDVILSTEIAEIGTLGDIVGNVVINEINYNSCDEFDPGDWIELYAPGAAVHMSYWTLFDDNDEHRFYFPEHTIIPEHGYLVIAEDPARFSALFPDVVGIVGPLDFGFSGSGDEVRLLSTNGQMIDAVAYDDAFPWPNAPDGDGPTLELINPGMDNSEAASWRASGVDAPNGTPGYENSVFTPTDNPPPPPIVFDWKIVNIFPNPFNSETRIEFLAPRSEHTTILIYDVLGRLTQAIPIQVAPGMQSMVWHGDMSNGTPAASGIYFVQIGSHESFSLRKVILLR